MPSTQRNPVKTYKWSPYMMEIVLHHFSSFDQFPRRMAPAYTSTVQNLIAIGVLEHNVDTYKTTELGNALIRMWMNTPLPVTSFVDPRTNEAV